MFVLAFNALYLQVQLRLHDSEHRAALAVSRKIRWRRNAGQCAGLYADQARDAQCSYFFRVAAALSLFAGCRRACRATHCSYYAGRAAAAEESIGAIGFQAGYKL